MNQSAKTDNLTDPAIASKLERLRGEIRSVGPCVIAFSGGVDSTLLLAVAHEELGEGIVAATARSPIHPHTDTDEAVRIAESLGVRHVLFDGREMTLESFVSNDPLRCYYCKKALFEDLERIRMKWGADAVIHGETVDDITDYRPGARAAMEAGARAPLRAASLTKTEVREISKLMGLRTWQREASPCLATRIPYGSPVTVEKLAVIEEAEVFLRSLGIKNVRVRHCGDTARIETDTRDIPILCGEGLRFKVVSRLKGLGFKYTALDLEGYEVGKMNRVLGV